MPQLHLEAINLAMAAREAASVLACATIGEKNAALAALADMLGRDAKKIFAANRRDVAAAKKAGLAPAMVDRLTVTPERLEKMIQGVQQVAALPDPVGQVIDGWTRPVEPIVSVASARFVILWTTQKEPAPRMAISICQHGAMRAKERVP